MEFINCDDFETPCCYSCHDDENEGYEGLWRDSVTVNGIQFNITVCCWKMDAADLKVEAIKRASNTLREM